MYCPRCGIHNIDTHIHCQICDADLRDAQKPEDVVIYADITLFPFFPVLREIVKNVNPFLWFPVLPGISLLYWIKKISGTPFLSPMLNSKTPKFHITELSHLRHLAHKPIRKAVNFLGNKGFMPQIDLEDVSMVQGDVLHIWRHPEQHVFATLHISKRQGALRYVTFSAFLPPPLLPINR